MPDIGSQEGPPGKPHHQARRQQGAGRREREARVDAGAGALLRPCGRPTRPNTTRRLGTAIPSPASNRHEPPSPPTSSDGNTTTSNLTYTVEGDEAISVATPVKLPAFRRNLTLAGGHCAPIHGMDDLSRKPRDSRPKCALMQVQDRLRHVARFRAPRDGTSRRSRRATSPVIAATIRPVTAATIIRPVAAATLGPVIPEPPARVSRHRRAR